jgi:hypothetical protein
MTPTLSHFKLAHRLLSPLSAGGENSKKVQEISLDLFGQPPKKSSNSPSKNFNVPSSAGYK